MVSAVGNAIKGRQPRNMAYLAQIYMSFLTMNPALVVTPREKGDALSRVRYIHLTAQHGLEVWTRSSSREQEQHAGGRVVAGAYPTIRHLPHWNDRRSIWNTHVVRMYCSMADGAVSSMFDLVETLYRHGDDRSAPTPNRTGADRKTCVGCDFQVTLRPPSPIQSLHVMTSIEQSQHVA